jgi:hypothetical protein
MATTTTNFGWDIPQSTDLVKDGATAIAALGQDIDTAFIDLKGGTTGQVLSKASNTDLDYTWVTDAAGDITGVTAGTGISGGGTSGTVTVTNSMATAITTAGDLIKGTGSGTFDRLGIGSAGQVLTVSGGAPAWASPAGGGKVLQVVQGTYSTATTIATTTMTDTGLSLSITPTSATSKILVLVNQLWTVERSSYEEGHSMRILRGATEVYTTASTNTAGYIYVANATGLAAGGVVSLCYLDSPATTSATTYKTQGRVQVTASAGTVYYQTNSGTSVITLMEIGA